MNIIQVLEQLNTGYGCNVASTLSHITNDNSSLGFKNAGSTGERKAASYILNEMRSIGLSDVQTYEFDVDAWEFRDCKLSYSMDNGENRTIQLSAFAGSCGVNENFIEAEIVYVSDGSLATCRGIELEGKIALLSFNTDNDYWIGVPVYQLERMGARAVIVMYEGESMGNHPSALNSGDTISRDRIPVLNISKENGKQLIEDLSVRTIYASLKIDITLCRGTSQNISGKIVGQGPGVILIGAHYDSFFRAYIDDAFGVGCILSIAKAIIESGQTPQNTIVFIAHGAEEFGVRNSHYDWCTGSWCQCTQIRPDWLHSLKLFLNIDAVNIDAESLLIQASPQVHDFFEKAMPQIKEMIEKQWEHGFQIKDVNGPYSDDFNYYMEGFPVAIMGRGQTSWRKTVYHTENDNSDDLHEDLMGMVSSLYTHIALTYDGISGDPANLVRETEKFAESIDGPLLEEEGINIEELMDRLHKLNLHLEKSQWDVRLSKSLVRLFRALNADDELVYRFSEVQRNLQLIKEVKLQLYEKNYSSAIDTIRDFRGATTMMNFD